MKMLAIAIAIALAHVPIVKNGEKVGRLTLMHQFEDLATCNDFIASDAFKDTLPQAKALAQEDDDGADIGDPYCEVAE